MSNPGTDNLVISGLNVFGFSHAGDFTISASPLPITITPGASTTINLTFKPGAIGSRSATLSIADNAAGSPHTVALTGTGTAPVMKVLPQSVIFGSQAVDSASNPRIVTVSNDGTGPMVVSAIAISGSAASDFAANAGALPVVIQPGASISLSVTFLPSATGSRLGTLTLAHDAEGGSTALPLSGTGIVSGPALNANPASLSFGNQQVGSTSAALMMLLENPGTENLVVSGLTISGTHAAEFAVNAPALPITIIPGGSVLLHVAFTPAAPGARSATLQVTHNAAESPLTAPLSGTGVAPVIELAPSSVNFGEQTVNTPSAPRFVTVNNSGTGPLTIFGISIIGSADSEFTVTSGTLPITVAPGGSTTLSVVFRPTALGSRPATLVISNNAIGTPHMLALSGQGLGTDATIAVNPLALNFESQVLNTTSAPQAVMVSNLGTKNLTVSSLSLSGPNTGDFQLAASALPIVILPGNSTTIQVRFSPQQNGVRSATLNILSDADNASPSVALTGTGFSAGAAINFSPQSLSFPDQPIGIASQPVYLTVSNIGSGNLVISELAISGVNASEFQLFGTVLPLTIAPSSSSVIGVVFTPLASGSRSASLNITDNAVGSPHVVPLTAAGSQPIATVNPGSINFGSRPALTISPPIGVVITNSGNAPLVVSSVSISPPTAVQFQVSAPPQPFTIAPGSSSTVNVTFAPTAAEPYSAQLIIHHNATGSPASVALSGSGTTVGIGIAPSSVNFGNQQLNVSSPASEVVISNPGSAALVISSLTITGAHAADYAATALSLPITVPPGESTRVNLVFTPKALGVRSAILAISDNASGSPHSVPLAGTGVGVANISLNPASLAFGNQALNTTSQAQTISIGNPGSSNLVISNLAITGTQAAEFAFTAPALPITVAPGATVSLSATFTPLNLGARGASLSLSTNVNGGTQTVPLTGTGVCAPASTVAPSSLSLGSQPVGSSTAAQ
ncbi:MAG: choice-of-anchor D domain-containing protein, partial [Thermomicrobiales bacterium]